MDWFKKTTSFTWFQQVKPQIRQGLTAALKIETSLSAISAYIQFIYNFVLENDTFCLVEILQEIFSKRRNVAKQLLEQEEICVLALKIFQKGLSISNSTDVIFFVFLFLLR